MTLQGQLTDQLRAFDMGTWSTSYLKRVFLKGGASKRENTIPMLSERLASLQRAPDVLLASAVTRPMDAPNIEQLGADPKDLASRPPSSGPMSMG